MDGSSIVAALNPGAYVSKIDHDLSTDTEWLERIKKVGDLSGAYVGYKYFGVGDVGGAPDKASVAWLEKAMAGDGPIRVLRIPGQCFRNRLLPRSRVARPLLVTLAQRIRNMSHRPKDD